MTLTADSKGPSGVDDDPLQVLWVDPDLASSRQFTSPHFLVAAVPTLAQALHLAERAAVVVSELRLDGDATGLELAQQLRNRGISVPLVLVSAHAKGFSEVDIKAAKAQGFFAKPYEPRALELTLLRLTSGASIP